MTARLVAGLSALVVALATAVLLTRQDPPPTRFDVGLQLLDGGQPELAVHMFDDPAWRGIAEYRSGRFNRALGEFFQTENTRSLYNMGTAYAQLEEWGGAIAAYERVLRVEPGHADARFNLALVKQARDLARRETADVRSEKKLGHWNEGLKSDPQESASDSENVEKGSASTNQASKPGDSADNPGKGSKSGGQGDDRQVDIGGVGTGRSDRGRENDRTGTLSGFSAASKAREDLMAAEVLLKEISDDPQRVLRARLENVHEQRQEKSKPCQGC